MAHIRQTIREAAATAITGLASGAPVYQSRVYPLEKQTLPALLVYSTEEAVDVDSMSLGSHAGLRTLTLRVEVVSRLASGMDDEIDTLCAEVEAALAASIDSSAGGSVGAYVKWGELVATEIELQSDPDAERQTGRAVMEWQLQYRTDTAAPTSAVA